MPSHHTSRSITLVTIAAFIVLVTSCGSDSAPLTGSAASSATSTSPELVDTDAAVNPDESTTSSSPATTPSTGAATDSTASADAPEIVNIWSGATVDPTKLPIGDDFVSTEVPAIGVLWACNAGNPSAGGASADGPWLNIAEGTWDLTAKLAVEGSNAWEAAAYSETVSNGVRTLITDSLPIADPTGNFPIAASDPAYQYDRNPGTITADTVTVTIPATGTIADSPSCVSEGAVGVMRNGVFVFNSLDGRGDDAVAHELQDLCNGHPAMTTYHYHNVPNCLRDKATGPSTVVGFAYDGFPIVVERDASGALPTNADLDECHGRTSAILLDGELIETYHYSATLEFPYFLGCYRGTAVA